MANNKSPFNPQFQCPNCGFTSQGVAPSVLSYKFNLPNLDNDDQFCTRCGASLWEDCFLCNGEGQTKELIMEDLSCVQCGYKLYLHEQTVECSACKGTGRVSQYHLCTGDNVSLPASTVIRKANIVRFPCPKCKSIPYEIGVPALPFKFNVLPIDDKELSCPQCGESRWTNCFLCGGSGQVPQPTIEDRYCGQCGRDLRPAEQPVECSACKGAGKISEYHICKVNTHKKLTTTTPFSSAPLSQSPDIDITEHPIPPESWAIETDLPNIEQDAHKQAETLVHNKSRSGSCGVFLGILVIVIVLLRFLLFW